MTEAEKRAREEIKRHPEYAGSYVTLGRIMLNEKRFPEALPALTKASELAPDNLLAHELLADAFTLCNRPQDALRTHKIILFLNPQNEKSKRAVAKLESITATEYSEDVFELQAPIQNTNSLELERSLSLFDALVFRNELVKAQKLLNDLEAGFPGHLEVTARKKLFQLDISTEDPLLRPDLSREKMALESKIRLLERLLVRLEERNRLHLL